MGFCITFDEHNVIPCKILTSYHILLLFTTKITKTKQTKNALQYSVPAADKKKKEKST